MACLCITHPVLLTASVIAVLCCSVEVQQQLRDVLLLPIYCWQVWEACCCLLHDSINKLACLGICFSCCSCLCCCCCLVVSILQIRQLVSNSRKHRCQQGLLPRAQQDSLGCCLGSCSSSGGCSRCCR
jgi:hypothetical protein